MTIKFKQSKSACKYCGGYERYEVSGKCPCRVKASNAKTNPARADRIDNVFRSFNGDLFKFLSEHVNRVGTLSVLPKTAKDLKALNGLLELSRQSSGKEIQYHIHHICPSSVSTVPSGKKVVGTLTPDNLVVISEQANKSLQDSWTQRMGFYVMAPKVKQTFTVAQIKRHIFGNIKGSENLLNEIQQKKLKSLARYREINKGKSEKEIKSQRADRESEKPMTVLMDQWGYTPCWPRDPEDGWTECISKDSLVQEVWEWWEGNIRCLPSSRWWDEQYDRVIAFVYGVHDHPDFHSYLVERTDIVQVMDDWWCRRGNQDVSPAT